MPICKHCGESVYQTRGSSWVHENGRGICSWAEPADPVHPPMPVGHIRACGCPECVAWLEAHEPGDPSS